MSANNARISSFKPLLNYITRRTSHVKCKGSNPQFNNKLSLLLRVTKRTYLYPYRICRLKSKK